MNTYNLALQREQDQRIANDAIALEQEIDRETDLYLLGQFDGAGAMAIAHPESLAYLAGYEEGKKRLERRKLAASKESEYGKVIQGYLHAGAHTISRHFGRLLPIGLDGDYQGWDLNLSGLDIEIATLDWENARLETKWAIYSHNPDALKHLATRFGEEQIEKAEGRGQRAEGKLKAKG